ncbi:hypothetical protein ACIHDR_19060 [Nocardia sp. NPDC052278]|uniref:hypothetical protein n=1 Tax=unclassified Nocardia TaxID=2637762 RepID=UPI00369BE1C0
MCVTAPDTERWDVYTVLADSETFGSPPQLATGETVDDEHAVAVCCGTAADAVAEGGHPCRTRAGRTCRPDARGFYQLGINEVTDDRGKQSGRRD